VLIKEPGYVYIYISNENETPVEVFFDDFKVEHKKSPVVQMDDYYPFGLRYNSYTRENSLSNKAKLFQGQEHIDDFALNWDSFKWRNHMPDIGRFFNVDPLADKYFYNSPYAFSENQVVAHRELEGLEKQTIKKGIIDPMENAIMPVVNDVKTTVANGVEAVADGVKAVGKAISRFGPWLQSLPIAAGSDRGGKTWTTKESAGGDQSKVSKGKADGGGNIDALLGPTIRSGPAKTTMEGVAQGIEMGLKAAEIVIDNVEVGDGTNASTPVKAVADTINNGKNNYQLRVIMTDGNDSVLQVTKNPDIDTSKKGNDKKNQ
jgi:hypothetical protein